MRVLEASVLVTAIALLGSPALDANADEQASEATVKEFIAVTGAGNLGVQVMQNMLPSLKRLVPSAPESFWTDFMHEVKPEDLEALLVPIYQKNFTENEIRETIKFYRSPTGQKVIRQLPKVMQESMAVGQVWGQQLAQRVIEKAKAANLDTSL
jgi:hypothetical protein